MTDFSARLVNLIWARRILTEVPEGAHRCELEQKLTEAEAKFYATLSQERSAAA